MTTRRRLKRLITAARHNELCNITLAVEVMASEPYADPHQTSSGGLCGYMTGAAEARERVDQYLDELAAGLRLTTP